MAEFWLVFMHLSFRSLRIFLLHWSKDSNIERLEQMCAVLREVTEADTVQLTQYGDIWREVSSQIVNYDHLYVLLGKVP